MINTQAKHTIVGARTERIESDPHFAGLQVSGTPVTLVEGGQVATLVLTATVPVLCSPQVVESCLLGTCLTFFSLQDRALGSCCVHLHLALGVAGQEQRCPWGGLLHRVRIRPLFIPTSKLDRSTFQNPFWDDFFKIIMFTDYQVGLPSCAHKICRHDWNSSHVIPLR